MFNNDSTPKIDYQFIVVYEKSNKQIAASIRNQAIDLKITSTIWGEKFYLGQETQLTNHNHVLFLSEKLIAENLSNPNLEEKELIPGVFYKKQGNNIGIYPKSENKSFVELANEYADFLKENWKMVIAGVICGGSVGGSIVTGYLFWKKQKKAKKYLLFKAADKFVKENLKDWLDNQKE